MKFTACFVLVWAAVALASEEAAETAAAAEPQLEDKRQEKRGILESDYGSYGALDTGAAISSYGPVSYGYAATHPISQTVTIEKPVAVPVPQPYAVKVPHAVPVPVHVPQPYAVHVPQPYPVVKHVAVPVEKHIPYPVVKHVPYAVPVYKPYAVPVPVYKHVHHYPTIVTRITKSSPKWSTW